MTWRVHLTNQAIRDLDILAGKPSLLAAWPQRDRVTYFELESGAPLDERLLRSTRAGELHSEKWREFVATLVAPNGLYLPTVHTPEATIYTTNDGQMRLYHVSDNGLFLEIEGKEIPLQSNGASTFTTVGLDRFLGLIAALDDQGSIHIFQQHIPVGVFDIGLTVQPELQPGLAISHGGASIFATDGQHVVLTDSSGRVRKETSVHYFVGRLTCSPNGRLLATSDLETGVIRIYNGGDLSPTHQRHAIDLLAEATQLQLLADLPPAAVALNAVVIDNNGLLAFSMAGVICVTDLEHMDALPRAQQLL